MMMTTLLESARDQQGSALLISLALIFVMAILGLALFELGVVEGRLVLTSQDDARAFEIAQAGMERALWKLQDTFNNDPSNPRTWATGSTRLCEGGSHRGCSDGRFHDAADSYISSSSRNFDSGSYSIQFMQVTEQTLSVPCQNTNPDGTQVTSDVDSTKKICTDLMFVRVTGSLTDSREGYSATRTIQLLARATRIPGTCLICGGLTGAAGTGMPINGNVRIAGSIRIAGVQGTESLSMGGGAGQTNSYAELDATSLARIPQLPLVCPFGRTCTSASDLVESLGATLHVARPTNVPAVTLSGSAALGQNGDRTYTADSGRKGKGPLDGIFVADGCNMPCTDNFTGVTLNSNTFVDDNNITKPYQGPVAPFPLLTGPWQIFGVEYTHFACVQGSSCTPPTTPPTPPTTTEFFVSRAANVMVSGNCFNTVGGTGCDPIISSLGSATGLTEATPYFETTIRFYDHHNPSRFMKARICWQRPLAGMPANTLEFGAPLSDDPALPAPVAPQPTCDTPASSSNPLLLYFPSSTPATTGFNIQRKDDPKDYNYRGSAIIVSNGLVWIEERWQTCQTTGAGTPCPGHQFTADSSLTVMTWGGNSGVCAGAASWCGNMNLGKNNSEIHRIMGLFYTGCDPTDPACGTSKGFLTSQKQTSIVGTVLGYRLCFAGGISPCSSGGNVPSFFQVIPDTNNLIATIAVPGSGGGFTVLPEPRYWVECKQSPPPGPLLSGCDYRP